MSRIRSSVEWVFGDIVNYLAFMDFKKNLKIRLSAVGKMYLVRPARTLAFFFALDSKFPGVGTLELSNPPGWGRKKRANAPSSVNTAKFFIDRTVE